MMNTEYTARYGLEFNPFLKNSKDILFESTDYHECVYRLGILSKTHGFGLITGAPGRGKTTILRSWSGSLNPALFKPVYTCLSTLTVQEFYRSLAYGLQIEPAFRKSDNFRLIRDEILRLSIEKKCTPVIIIDEANHISNAILNDLKMLFNFEMDSRDPAVVVLAGLPVLNSTLKLGIHESLRQRITMSYQLDGLTKDEARHFISEKLSGAGCHSAVFESAAVEGIVNAAEGTPRMICKLCNAALIIGASRNQQLIDADTVLKAVDECEI